MKAYVFLVSAGLAMLLILAVGACYQIPYTDKVDCNCPDGNPTGLDDDDNDNDNDDNDDNNDTTTNDDDDSSPGADDDDNDNDDNDSSPADDDASPADDDDSYACTGQFCEQMFEIDCTIYLTIQQCVQGQQDRCPNGDWDQLDTCLCDCQIIPEDPPEENCYKMAICLQNCLNHECVVQ